MHPVLIQFGPLAIRWYGVMYGIGILIGGWLLGKEFRRKGIALPAVLGLPCRRAMFVAGVLMVSLFVRCRCGIGGRVRRAAFVGLSLQDERNGAEELGCCDRSADETARHHR